AAVRATDPKEVQARFTKQAKETQAKVSETLGSIDTDIKKLREQAQHLALQSVGVAAEYAVKAREAYDELADRGRGAVKNWRGEDAGTPEVTVEREPVKVAEPPAQPRGGTQSGKAGTSGTGSTSGPGSTSGTASTAGGTTQTGQGSAGSASAAKKSTARKTTTARTSTAKSNSTKPGTAQSNGGKKTPPKSGS
ncbi:hypothetical protein DB35_23315, partial [Streptomyces abyssalis]